MKRLFIPIILFSLSFFTASAQMQVPASYGSSIGFGLGSAAAIGPASNYYRVSVDAVVMGELHVTQTFNLTGSVGLQTFFSNSTYGYHLKESNLPDPVFKLIPIKVGGKWYLADEWYTEAETGAVLYTIDYKHPALTIGVGTGFSFQMEGNRAFDIGARFENLTRQDLPGQVNFEHFLALRLAWKFGL